MEVLSLRQDEIAELASMFERASTVAIAAHTHPDGDALGSCLALRSFLEDVLGKKAYIVNSDCMPSSLSFLCGGVTTYTYLPDSDLIVLLDANAFDRTGNLEQELSGAQVPKVLIDHHLNPDRESFDLVFSRTCVSSACELLYNILLAMPQIGGNASKLPPAALYALMTGMTTDTNNFANSVFPSTLRMASELLDAGVDRESIISHLYQEYRENRIQLFSYLLNRKLVVTESGCAYVIMDERTARAYDIQEGETEGLVNIPLGIRNVKISLFLKEEGDHFRVSIRSKRGYSANSLARDHFNGGGHEQAAGGKLFRGRDIAAFEDAPDYIEKVVGPYLQSGTINAEKV